MQKKKPSIFNDVIGPVMRGPSSSHTAASWRIARLSLSILGEPLKSALIEFDKNGAWASNYREQGTVIGINGGLLGLDMTDDNIKDSEFLSGKMGVDITYQVSSFETKHTNTVRLSLEGQFGKKSRIVAVSVSGGAFEIQQVDNFEVCLQGNYFELLFRVKSSGRTVQEILQSIPQNVIINQSIQEDEILINIKSSEEISPELRMQIEKISQRQCIVLNPILPLVAGKGSELPFVTVESLMDYAQKNKLDLGDLGLVYEKHLSGLSNEILREKMKQVVDIIEGSIKKGLKGTSYKDRILPQQSHLIKKANDEGKILRNMVINNSIAYVSAIMESKSAMEVVVANPTAGSCGAVGGVLKAVAEERGSSSEDVIKAYFAAGIIGAYFAQGPGFSAEEHGCQVECGASSGMAAAGIVQLMKGTAEQAINAASMAIQNMIGLVCDPVADRVEVPCLGKNISAAMNAISSATMACSGFDPVIPLDEVIETVSRVGDMMPACVKCTGQGGLAMTTTSIQLKQKLEN